MTSSMSELEKKPAGTPPARTAASSVGMTSPAGASNHASVTPLWTTLPADLQAVIAQPVFDGMSLVERGIVLRVRAALLQVHLWDGVATITGVNVTYRQINATVKPDLLGRLHARESGFSHDGRFMGLFHKDMDSFRQLGRAGKEGLHISIGKSGSGFATIHLDSYSPATGRDKKGFTETTPKYLFGHGSRDLHYAPEPGELPWDTENAQRSRSF